MNFLRTPLNSLKLISRKILDSVGNTASLLHAAALWHFPNNHNILI